MSKININRTAAAARIGVSPDCTWEQALNAFNFRRMELFGKYLAPLNEDDIQQRSAEIAPLYEALRVLFPVEVEQEPALKDLPVLPPVTPAPQESLQTIVQKDKRKGERRPLSVSFHGRNAYLVFALVSALLFTAFVILVEASKTAPPQPNATAIEIMPVQMVFVVSSSLNVREKPGLSGPVLAYLKQGEQVYFLGERTDWTQRIILNRIEYNDYWVRIRTETGVEGWVFGAFIHYYQKQL